MTSTKTLVIFGATGHLAQTKLFPALYQLFSEERLPDSFRIISVGRSEIASTAFRNTVAQSLSLPTDESGSLLPTASTFLHTISYVAVDPHLPQAFGRLRSKLEDIGHGILPSVLYYLSTPPSLYRPIAEGLAFCRLTRLSGAEQQTRIVVEKPFGSNLETAKQLDITLRKSFDEADIYRIDHFLGKETVLNIMALRFANGIFEPLWNRNFIDHIEITAVEKQGIGSRAGFYDSVGALRDMIQNHLIQLVAITTMEPPATFSADTFRNEITKLYQALRPMTSNDILHNVVRGQYTNSDTAVGYRFEPNVDTSSRTETFVAMRLYIDNWRWKEIPIFIRTGKQMPTKVTEVVIHFKAPPHNLFGENPGGDGGNKLIIRIQPNEGIVVRIAVKVPGGGYQIKDVSLDFTYDRITTGTFNDAYTRLIQDAVNGDNTLFSRSDAVESSWRFFDPIIKLWSDIPEIPLYGYPAGSWGPPEATQLMHQGESWTNPCRNLTDTDSYCEL